MSTAMWPAPPSPSCGAEAPSRCHLPQPLAAATLLSVSVLTTLNARPSGAVFIPGRGSGPLGCVCAESKAIVVWWEPVHTPTRAAGVLHSHLCVCVCVCVLFCYVALLCTISHGYLVVVLVYLFLLRLGMFLYINCRSFLFLFLWHLLHIKKKYWISSLFSLSGRSIFLSAVCFVLSSLETGVHTSSPSGTCADSPVEAVSGTQDGEPGPGSQEETPEPRLPGLSVALP